LLLAGCSESSQKPLTQGPADSDFQRSELAHDESQNVSVSDFDLFIRDNHDYTFAIYKQLIEQNNSGTGNPLISPISMGTAFSTCCQRGRFRVRQSRY
jgi:serine protease inhibitor